MSNKDGREASHVPQVKASGRKVTSESGGVGRRGVIILIRFVEDEWVATDSCQEVKILLTLPVETYLLMLLVISFLGFYLATM